MCETRIVDRAAVVAAAIVLAILLAPGPVLGQNAVDLLMSQGDASLANQQLPGLPEPLSSPLAAPPATALQADDPPRPLSFGEPWTAQMLPEGLIYRPYLAGAKEPRFASQWVYDRSQGWIWDVTLGARVGIFRYGTTDPLRPEGWQLDMEGAAFPRLDCEESLDLMAADYRFGIPMTYGYGRYQTKFGFYHISSHLGDELMLRHSEVPRLNYSRNAFNWGNSYYLTEDIRLYVEAGWAYYVNGGALPWEFQFGVDYSPAMPTGCRPVPFIALNGHIRQDVNFGGNLVVQTGYQWRGPSNHLFRAGMHYYTGKSDQYEFFNRFEDKIGLGLWYDF